MRPHLLYLLCSLTEEELIAEMRTMSRAELLVIYEAAGIHDCPCDATDEHGKKLAPCCERHRRNEAARAYRGMLLPYDAHAALLRLLWPEEYEDQSHAS